MAVPKTAALPLGYAPKLKILITQTPINHIVLDKTDQ